MDGKRLVFIGSVMAMAGSPVQAGDGEDRPGFHHENLITVGVMFAPLGTRVRYQRVLKENLSAFGILGYGAKDDWFGSGYNAQRISGELGVDLHPMGKNLHGFYTGPRVGYQSWSLTEDVEQNATVYPMTTLEFDAAAGWRWVANSGFTALLGLNIGYSIFSQDDDLEDIGITVNRSNGVRLGGDFALGWSF